MEFQSVSQNGLVPETELKNIDSKFALAVSTTSTVIGQVVVLKALSNAAMYKTEPVTFYSSFNNGSTTTTVTLGTATFVDTTTAPLLTTSLGTGTHELYATWPGEGRYAAKTTADAKVTLSISSGTVLGGIIDVTVLPASASYVVGEGTATIYATLTTSTNIDGFIRFYSDSTYLGRADLFANQAMLVSDALPAGVNNIICEWPGGTVEGTLYQGKIGTSSYTVLRGTTIASTLTLTVNSTKAIYQEGSLTFTAHLNTTTAYPGNILFYRDSTYLASRTMTDNVATYVLTNNISTGTYNFSAQWDGNQSSHPRYIEKTSNTVAVNVYDRDTIPSLTLTVNPSTSVRLSGNILLTATANTSTLAYGDVKFYAGSTLFASTTLTNNVAEILIPTSMAVGTYTMYAQYVGSDVEPKFYPVTSNSATLTVLDGFDIGSPLVLTASSPKVIDEPIILTARITTSTTMGSVVAFFANNIVVGSATMNASGVATTTTTFASTGNYIARAYWTGGYLSNGLPYSGKHSNTTTLAVTAADTLGGTFTLTANSATTVISNNLTLTARLNTSTVITGTTAGNVTFKAQSIPPTYTVSTVTTITTNSYQVTQLSGPHGTSDKYWMMYVTDFTPFENSTWLDSYGNKMIKVSKDGVEQYGVYSYYMDPTPNKHIHIYSQIGAPEVYGEFEDLNLALVGQTNPSFSSLWNTAPLKGVLENHVTVVTTTTNTTILATSTFVNNASTVTVQGTTLGLGTWTVFADWAGKSVVPKLFGKTSNTLTQRIVPKIAPSISLNFSQNPYKYYTTSLAYNSGLTATVFLSGVYGAPTGGVEFVDITDAEPIPLGVGAAQTGSTGSTATIFWNPNTLNQPPEQTRIIRASYQGDNNYLTTTSTSTVSITGAGVAASLSVNPTTPGYISGGTHAGKVFAGTVNFKCSFGQTDYAPSTVNFYNGGSFIGTATVVNGDALLNDIALTAGTYTITVSYTPTIYYNSANTLTLPVVSTVSLPVTGWKNHNYRLAAGNKIGTGSNLPVSANQWMYAPGLLTSNPDTYLTPPTGYSAGDAFEGPTPAVEFAGFYAKGGLQQGLAYRFKFRIADVPYLPESVRNSITTAIKPGNYAEHAANATTNSIQNPIASAYYGNLQVQLVSNTLATDGYITYDVTLNGFSTGVASHRGFMGIWLEVNGTNITTSRSSNANSTSGYDVNYVQS